jgi:hypothetical protein
MPAPIDIMSAYVSAKKDASKAATMTEMGIDHTIQFWATATDGAKEAVKAFLLPSPRTA